MATDSSSTADRDAAAHVGAGSLVRWLSVGTAIWVGVLGLTVTSLAGWQYWRVSLRAIDEDLTETARALGDRITVVDGLLEISDVNDVFDEPADDVDRYQAIYGADGHLLYGTSTLLPDDLTAGAPARTRAGFREVQLPGPNGSIVVAGRSLDNTLADLRRLAASLTLASLAGAVLTMPVAVWLRRQLARSIAQIDETARTLKPGQPSRVDVSRVADEFVGVAGTLNRAFDRLDDAVARERRLTSDASHELRTPATTLLAEARWALGRPRSVEEYRASLEVCARQAGRMKELVESLLILARLDAGTFVPARTRVSLRTLAEDVATELQPLAARHRVTLAVDGQAVVWADAVLMRVLVSNLLSNAIRYNRPDGSVRVDVSAVETTAVLTVRDTGHGLPAAMVPHVFDRFWRASPARSSRDGGIGLGLAISKAILDAHEGTIEVESDVGIGTTFVVRLPAEAPALSDAER